MEIWKDIIGYEDYKISSLGRVKSLKFRKEKILKGGISDDGYRNIILCKNGSRKTKKIHQLVAIAFLNHNPCGYELVVNHKNFIRTDNNVNNLEIITSRENTNQKHFKNSSQFVGVCWHKSSKKWHSSINIKGKLKYLGLFLTEIEAHNAYQNKLLSLDI